jgi:hypothetical protein
LRATILRKGAEPQKDINYQDIEFLKNKKSSISKNGALFGVN